MSLDWLQGPGGILPINTAGPSRESKMSSWKFIQQIHDRLWWSQPPAWCKWHNWGRPITNPGGPSTPYANLIWSSGETRNNHGLISGYSCPFATEDLWNATTTAIFPCISSVLYSECPTASWRETTKRHNGNSVHWNFAPVHWAKWGFEAITMLWFENH